MLNKMAVNEDARMRLQGQHVPEAPRTAHGQMSFVFSAPVCLFPVPPPAGQLKIRVVQPSYAASLGPSKRAATWMKSEAVLLVTIVALFPELRQELESKLLKPQSALKIKQLALGI